MTIYYSNDILNDDSLRAGYACAVKFISPTARVADYGRNVHLVKNRKIKIFTLFVVFVLMLGVFGACKRATKGIVITDNEGKTRVLATNDKGETMTDEAGNLIILVTGLDGKEETQRVAMPDSYVSGKTIETKKYTVVIPKGWEQDTGLGDVKLIHKKTDGEINLVTMDGKTLEYAIDEAEQFMMSIENEGGTVETTAATICEVEAKKYVARAGNGNPITFYIFEKNGTVYSFYTAVAEEHKDSVDFEAVINSIVFK